ncbi:MAG: META domain-containing protein [Gemmatimonadales bacterium]|nr:META domain-containing protein [Gemmatimonadales bacterium]
MSRAWRRWIVMGLLALLPAGCARREARPADGGVLQGALAFPAGIALPAGATIEVRLDDVSRQDAAAATMAETTFVAGTTVGPIPFTLRFPAESIVESRSYSARASVRSGSRLLYTTTAAYRVLTQGNPARVDLALVRVPEAAGTPAAALVGTAWRLADLAGTVAISGTHATLEFPQAGRVIGSGSCNRFFGPVELAGDTIRVGALAVTRKACAEPAMRQEARYLAALAAAARLTVDATALLLYPGDGGQPLRFVPERP